MSDPIMRSGDLRHRVVLQTPNETQDSVKDVVRSWSNVGTFWAFVQPASGREQLIGQQLQAQVSHSVTMRYQGSTAVTPKMRLQFGSRTFNIVSVLNTDERKYLLKLYVMENV